MVMDLHGVNREIILRRRVLRRRAFHQVIESVIISDQGKGPGECPGLSIACLPRDRDD